MLKNAVHECRRLAAAAAALFFAAAVLAEPIVQTPAGVAIPQELLPIRLAINKYVRPSPNEPMIEATIDAMKKAFGDNVEVTFLSIPDLQQALKSGKVDIFVSSTGFYYRMLQEGATLIASVASDKYPNPNMNDGAAFVVNADRTDLQTVKDLEGSRLVASTRIAFTGMHVPMGEIHRSGFDEEHFFSDMILLGDDDAMKDALPLLKSGAADVGFFRMCFLEDWMTKHPNEASWFRVINRKDKPGEACQRSTPLYPSWTIGATASTDPRISRFVTKLLFEVPPQGPDGLYWSIATDFTAVSELFRDLKLGPYEYLRTWTWERFLDEYGTQTGFLLFFILGLILHAVRSENLVRVRTTALQAALKEQERLRKEAQDANNRIANMGRASAISQLSSIFAHEVRQPLATLSLYVYGLKKRVAAGTATPEVLASTISKVADQAERVNQIVERVRSYGKADAAKPEMIDLNGITARAVSDLAKTGYPTDLIRFDPLTVPALLYADPLDLELVVLNLLKNALEAIKVQGKEGRVKVSVRKDDEGIEFRVEDNGPYISDDDFASLSEMRPSRKPQGLGLGLAIVRGIVERARGRMRFARGRNSGLIVTVRLPAAAENISDNKGTNDETAGR